MSVKISVIVPVYNGEKYLRECLDSIAGQTLRELEVLCVDDGSKDGSAAILKEYAEKDARFQFLPQENLGVSAARNRALKSAHGEFIAFMDCDDFYPAKDALEKLYSAAVDNEADIVGGSLGELYPDGTMKTDFDGKKSPYTFCKNGWLNLHSCPFEYGAPRYLFRRSLIVENKLEYPPYKTYEDPVFLVRAMIAARRFYAIPDVVYMYRQRGTKPAYSPAKVHDLVSGGIDILRAAKSAALPELYRKYAEDFFGDFSEGDETATGNLCITQMLDGDIELAKKLFSTSDVLDGKLIAPLAKILGQNMKVGAGFFDSPEWTAACRKYQRSCKIHGFFRCLRENGVLYTLNRIMKRG